MLFGPLGDGGVVDQSAEERGHLGPDVQLLLQGGKGNVFSSAGTD